MKLEKSCGSVVFNEDKVLIVKHNLGHWDFPKGHIEEGESEEETTIREVKEETNIDIGVDSNFRYVVRYSPRKNVIKDVIYFRGVAKSFDMKNQEEEINTVKFVSIEEAYELLTFDNTKDLLTKVLNDMNK